MSPRASAQPGAALGPGRPAAVRGSAGRRVPGAAPRGGEAADADRAGRGQTAIDPDRLVVVGEITRPHGVHGAVRVVPVTDFPDHLLRLREVVVVRDGKAWPARVQRARAAGRVVAMKLAGVETPEAARALCGATLRIPQEDVPPLPAGVFYVFQVVGLRVRTPEGRPLGTVADVLRTGSNDVYVVRSAGEDEILLPAVEGVVEAIDPARGEIVARPPEWV